MLGGCVGMRGEDPVVVRLPHRPRGGRETQRVGLSALATTLIRVFALGDLREQVVGNAEAHVLVEPVGAQLLRHGLGVRRDEVEEHARIHRGQGPAVALLEVGEEVRSTEWSEPARQRLTVKTVAGALAEREEVQPVPQVVSRKVVATAEQDAAALVVVPGNRVDQRPSDSLTLAGCGDDELHEPDLVAR